MTPFRTLTVSLLFIAAAPQQGFAASEVGVAAAVNQSAVGTAPGAHVRTIALGDNVVFNESVETNADGLVQILLADGTAFTIGPNSALTIDSFIYDPSANTASVAATFTKGVFRFVGGRTSKTGGATINTPIGEIGVRGAIMSGSSANGSEPDHVDLVDPRRANAFKGRQRTRNGLPARLFPGEWRPGPEDAVRVDGGGHRRADEPSGHDRRREPKPDQPTGRNGRAGDRVEQFRGHEYGFHEHVDLDDWPAATAAREAGRRRIAGFAINDHQPASAASTTDPRAFDRIDACHEL